MSTRKKKTSSNASFDQSEVLTDDVGYDTVTTIDGADFEESEIIDVNPSEELLDRLKTEENLIVEQPVKLTDEEIRKQVERAVLRKR
jgi:hypothetical protein